MKEGRIKENADDRIMELFHQQRKLLEIKQIEELNKQSSQPELLPGTYILELNSGELFIFLRLQKIEL